MFEFLINNYHIFTSFIIMIIGLLAIILCNNLVKKMIALSIFQTSALLMYVSSSYIENGQTPIYQFKESETGTKEVILGDYLNSGSEIIYHNPLPHVLMLTAIVVGVAVLSVGLALTLKIYSKYKTLDENKIINKEEFND